jgi:hypothetical protein
MLLVGLARLASFFLLLSQKKETKEKATPLPLYPSVLAPHLGGCGTRAFSTQTVLAAYPSAAQAEGAARGLKVKPHYFLSSFRA